MLNILISLLKDHSSSSAGALNGLSLRRSKTTPTQHHHQHTCVLFSSHHHRPSSLSVSIHRLWGLYWQLRGNIGIRAAIRVSVKAEAAGHQRRTDTRYVVTAAPLWDGWSGLLARSFKINRTSCPYKMLRLDFCSTFGFCCITYHL